MKILKKIWINHKKLKKKLPIDHENLKKNPDKSLKIVKIAINHVTSPA